MARSRMKFKPSLKESMRLSHAAQKFMAMGAPDEKREEAEARLNELFSGVDIDAVHKKRAAPRQLEAEALRAVRQLVAVHPKIDWILRVNSGAASFEAKTGKWQPVKFHEWVRSPVAFRMPDLYGKMVDGRDIALEIKRPDWKKPSDQREIEQAAFLHRVRDHGGIGEFVRSVEEAQRAIEHG